MWKLMEILNVFNALTLKNIFWKTKTFFKKWAYRFLDESTKIANAIFPYKTALSEANVKTKWVVQNAPITKNEVFASIYLIFSKFCFTLRTSYQVDVMYQLPKTISILFLSGEVLSEGGFSWWICIMC